MNRRGFLGAVAALAVVPVAAWAQPVAVPAAVPALAFHPDAFSMVMPMPARLDLLYGFAMPRPEFAVRIIGA